MGRRGQIAAIAAIAATAPLGACRERTDGVPSRGSASPGLATRPAETPRMYTSGAPGWFVELVASAR